MASDSGSFPDRPAVCRRLVGGRARGGARVVALAALLLLLPTGPAAAGTSGSAALVAFPAISVIGNGHRYTGVSAIGYAWAGRIDIDSGAAGRIKHWRMWPFLSIEGFPVLPLEAAGQAAWYPSASDPWPRPKHVDVTVIRLFPDVSIKDYVVAACNQRAAELRQAGQSDAQIFGSAHTLNAHGGVNSEVDVTIGGLAMEAQGPLAVEVVCAKWDGAILPPPKGGGDFTGPIEVKEAKLVVFPDQHAGACPVQLSLFGKVTGNRFGSFESWVESTEGWKSTKTVRNIASKTNGAYEEQFTEKVTVPIVLPTGTPGGGGPAGGQVAGGGNLASPKPPVDPIPGGKKPPVSPGGGLTTGRPGNVHQAALRVVATAGGKTVTSGWQDYKVTCDPKVAPGLVPIDVLAAEIRVVQSTLAVKPRTNQLGKCEVELTGKIWTNVAHADVTLAYRNHKGVTTPEREVTTGANKEVTFTDTLDFSKTGGGLWIEQGGVIGSGGGPAGPYTGSFQIVGQSVVFQSSPAPYSFTCTNKAPGGLVANPGTPKTTFPPVGPLTNTPREPEKGGQGGGNERLAREGRRRLRKRHRRLRRSLASTSPPSCSR